MTENDWMDHWQNLYNDIFIVGPPEMRERQKPTDDHLNRLEKILNKPLPPSYKTFVKVFGPGRIARSINIYAPGYRGADVIDFLGNNNWQDFEAQRRNDPEQIRRLVAFASLEYQNFVWDTGDICDAGGAEYRIYYVPKSLEESLIKICDSFQGFIEEFCLTGEFWRLFGAEPEETWVDEETGETRSIRCFFPIGPNPTSKV